MAVEEIREDTSCGKAVDESLDDDRQHVSCRSVRAGLTGS